MIGMIGDIYSSYHHLYCKSTVFAILFSAHQLAHQRPPVFERAMIDPRNSTLGFTFFCRGANQKCPLIAVSKVMGGH